MVSDDKIKMVLEYVDWDLEEIQHNNYEGVIKKMHSVSSSILSDALAIINLGILNVLSEQKPDKNPGGVIIPIAKYQASEKREANT